MNLTDQSIVSPNSRRLLGYSVPVILFVLALILGLHKIDIQYLSMDEGATYFFSRMDFLGIVDSGEPNSPTFYLIEGWIVNTFGRTELSIKFLPIVSYALCVPFTYLATKELYGNIPACLTSSALVLMSPVMIWYAQEARGFSCAACLVMLQLWLFAIYINRIDNRTIWIMFAIASGLAVHMHYIAMMPTALFYAFALVRQRKKGINNIVRSNTILSLLIMIILILPVFPSLHNAFRASMGYDDTWVSGIDYLKDAAIAFFYGSTSTAIVMSILLVIGIIFSFYRDKEGTVLLLIVSLIPFIFTLWVSTFSHVHFRYTLFSAPILYMLIASPLCAFEHLKNPVPRWIPAICTVVCIALIVTASVPVLEDQYQTRDNGMRYVVDILEQEAQEGDVIIYSPEWLEWGIGGCLDFYYDSGSQGTMIVKTDTMETVDTIRTQHPSSTIFIITWDGDTEVINWARSGTETEMLYSSGQLMLHRLV